MHQFARNADSDSHGEWKPYVVDASGNYWRVYLFIENARSYDVLETEQQAYEAAKVFGQFQADLVDLPGPRLIETIPDFHNTPARVAALEKAIREDRCGRVASVRKEIDFVLSRREEAGRLLELNARGVIPERITHNDTKLNNVLIDTENGTGICVIDLTPSCRDLPTTISATWSAPGPVPRRR